MGIGGIKVKHPLENRQIGGWFDTCPHQGKVSLPSYLRVPMVFFSLWRVTEWQVIRVYYYQLGVSSDPSAHLRWALHSSHSCVHWQAPICNWMVFKFLLFHLMIWKRNSMSKQMLTKEDAGRRMWRDTWVILMNLTKNPPLELHDAEHQRMRSGGVLQQRLSLRCRVIQITSKHTFKKKRQFDCDSVIWESITSTGFSAAQPAYYCSWAETTSISACEMK